jgi:bifunctional UDP-N-acetylglucosamine pyrophosphorylase/glucosamine-1-phosphate N-acetyltransferase
VIGDDVQIGVNVSIYPGRKIGSGAWVGPGVVVASDIRRDARILVAQRTKSLSLSSDRGA